MRKNLLTLVFLFAVLLIKAQTVLVHPNFKSGDQKYYLENIIIEKGDQKIDFLFVQRVKVLSQDASGYTMETEIKEYEIHYTQRTFDTDLLETIWKSRKNNVYKFKTNTSGSIVKLLNANDVMAKGEENLGDTWELVFWGKYPELFENIQQQLGLRKSVLAGLTEPGFIDWMQEPPFLFSQFGKQYVKNTKEHYKANDGLIMQKTIDSIEFGEKREVKVEITEKLDMSIEERKQLIFDLLKKEYPDNIDDAEKILDDAFKASGLGELKKVRVMTFIFDSNFWPIKFSFGEKDNTTVTKYMLDLLTDEKIKELLR